MGIIALAIITALAFFTRFYMLDHPSEVVFDEVHFGKFASYVPDPSTMSHNNSFPQGPNLHVLLVVPVFACSGGFFKRVLTTVSPTTILLRRPPSHGQNAFRLRGLVSWVRRALPL